MTLLVVDSSVAIKWFLNEPLADQALEILAAVERRDVETIVPDILHAEVANVFWKKHLFQGFARSDCEKYLCDFEALSLPFVPVTRLFQRAFELAVQYRRSVYDILYVALAEREECRFITADERLLNAVSPSIPSVTF